MVTDNYQTVWIVWNRVITIHWVEMYIVYIRKGTVLEKLFGPFDNLCRWVNEMDCKGVEKNNYY